MVMRVKWDQSFSTGIGTLDEQHKQLFKLIDDLHEGIRTKRNRETIGLALTGLGMYTKTHFASEEELMKSTGYPDLAPHRQEHLEFVAKVNDLNERYEKGDAVMTVEVIAFIVRWLQDHIQKVDRAYGPHLAANGVK